MKTLDKTKLSRKWTTAAAIKAAISRWDNRLEEWCTARLPALLVVAGFVFCCLLCLSPKEMAMLFGGESDGTPPTPQRPGGAGRFGRPGHVSRESTNTSR